MQPDPHTLTPLQRWSLAVRPKTLAAAVAPVVLGGGIAFTTGSFRWSAWLAALFGAVMIQIGTNLVNDVVDFSKGADTAERTGPTRVTESGLLTEKQVWRAVWLSYGLAVLAGVYLTWLAGWPVVVIGLASLLAGIAYTAGPYPLAYVGLGGLFVFVFFGFVAVGGTVYVASGQLPLLAWFGGSAAGALIVNILVVNNIRDIESDRKAGRRNLPVLLGRRAAEVQFLLMLVTAYAVPPILICKSLAGWWSLLPFLTLPQAARLLAVLRAGTHGPALNPILGQTAQLALRFCALLALGLLLGSYLTLPV